MDKISPIKKRILEFIDYKGITRKEFCDIVHISYSNMKSKSLESEIGGEYLSNIMNNFDEISPLWLLTGKGEMICGKKEEKEEVAESAEFLKEKIELLQENRQMLKEKTSLLEKINAQLEIISQLKDENKDLNNRIGLGNFNPGTLLPEMLK